MTHVSVYRLSCISEVTIVFAAVSPAGKQPQNFLALNLTVLVPSALHSLLVAIKTQI